MNETTHSKADRSGRNAPVGTSSSIIALECFIQATRDSGYKGTASAVAELIDNSIQAGADHIEITICTSSTELKFPIEFTVADNGCGMSPADLRQALRFGGSTRFDNRSGLGRYGMGLPNSSLSQARRVAVYTWQAPRYVYSTYLDVDEIAAGVMSEVPRPRRVPALESTQRGASGTVVHWSKCDRLDHRRTSTISRKLIASIGRRFRHYIINGTTISVNGEIVTSIDPLYLDARSQYSGAAVYGEPIEIEVSPNPSDSSISPGRVRITFSELPVREWYAFSNKVKQDMGISKGAGISIVRAGREVDYGWFFLGSKRRENYDDWWRCEISFDPLLDEAFGITHTKQQVRPSSHLLEALVPDIESTARALNSRARKEHFAAKTIQRFSSAEARAAKSESALLPLPKTTFPQDDALCQLITRLHPHVAPTVLPSPAAASTRFHIVEDRLPRIGEAESFFTTVHGDGSIIVVLNIDHPFYRHVYKPLLDPAHIGNGTLRTYFDLILLAAARSEAAFERSEARVLLAEYRQAWGRVLANYLND